MDYLSMINPMETELRHVNDISAREMAKKAHEEFENMADISTKVLPPAPTQVWHS